MSAGALGWWGLRPSLRDRARLVSFPTIRRISRRMLAGSRQSLHEEIDQDADDARNSDSEEYGTIEHGHAPARRARATI
jgi:hypothetical protein